MTSAGSECVRCARDKHCPKSFSSVNNVDPGPIPKELMVSFCSLSGLCFNIAYIHCRG